MSAAILTVAIFFAFSNLLSVSAQSGNLAFGKSANQSSNLNVSWAPPNSSLASAAVDGNTDGNANNGSVTHTGCGTQLPSGDCSGTVNPWWQVDLGGEFIVEKIQIWNRTDCCSDRLDNFRIWVKGNIGNWEEYDPRFGLQRFSQLNPLTINGRKTARWVRIQIENPAAMLSLAEVMVFGSSPALMGGSPGGSPSSGGNSPDEQFWNLIKNSTKAADFQSYLDAFPNGQFAALARFNRDRLSGVSSPPTNTGSGTVSGGGVSVDEQFWNNVKSSNNARDFQSYLDNFPNGQFAALARFNRDRLGGVSSPPTNTGSGTVSGGGLSVDEQFWNNVKNSNNARDYQSYLDNFPNGQFVALARFNRDRLSGGGGGTTITSPPVFTPTTSSNAAMINNSAVETRRSLPLTLGQVQLFAAESHCVSGCQVSDNTESVVISAKTPSLSKQNMTIGQIEAFLKPQLLKTYCGTPEQRSGISMGVTAVDMFNQPYGNFFLVSRDCGGTTGTTSTTVAKPPATGFQQVISSAQPGSISEIARARRFFVVSNDFSVKSKITAAILKELPQMQAASTEQQADFLIGFELTDRTTGLVTPNDANNPNLKGELIVFTMIPASGGNPERARILFRVTKERGFGVFSATPDESAAKEFAKQFAKVII